MSILLSVAGHITDNITVIIMLNYSYVTGFSKNGGITRQTAEEFLQCIHRIVLKCLFQKMHFYLTFLIILSPVRIDACLAAYNFIVDFLHLSCLPKRAEAISSEHLKKNYHYL